MLLLSFIFNSRRREKKAIRIDVFVNNLLRKENLVGNENLGKGCDKMGGKEEERQKRRREPIEQKKGISDEKR